MKAPVLHNESRKQFKIRGIMRLNEDGQINVDGAMSRWVRLADGAKAHYMTSGESGPSVILCHGGLPGSSAIAGWRYQFKNLAESGFRVYAPDFPGFGLADTDPRYWPRLGSQSHVEFLYKFMESLCIETAHFAGNSMGCGNAARFAISYPEKVLSLVLIAGNLPGLVDPDKVYRTINVTTLNRETFDGTPESMLKMMEPIIFDRSAITEELLQMRTLSAVKQKESLAAYHHGNDRLQNDKNFNRRFQIQGRLDQIKVPQILLWGRDDILNPVTNAFLQEDVTPWIQYFYPFDCGHQGQTDKPDLFNKIFVEFFRNSKISRQTAVKAGVSERKPEIQNLVAQEIDNG